jgi:hypothetical protein
MRRVAVTGAITLLAIAALAVAGTDETKLEGVGSAKVRWNAVPYREELMEQLSPGLTWRLGKDDATRLEIKGMALVNGNSILFPGKVTLNLRYWSQIRWDLVVFEKNDWKWGPDVGELGLIPAKVGKIPDEKKAAKSLQLELRDVTKANQSEIPTPVLTGVDKDMLDPDEVSDSVGYSPAAQKQFDAVPMLELHMRFGPHTGIVSFEATKFGELKGKKEGGGKKQKLRIRYPKHPAPLARTEFLEQHDGQLTVGLWDEGAPNGEPVVLVLSGGETPMLWPVTVGPDGETQDRKELEPIEGARQTTKKSPKTMEATLDGNVLTIHLDKVAYTFSL